MKMSIRLKLFAATSGLVLLFIMLAWIFNSFFLDDYYMHTKRKILLESYEKIDSIYKGTPDDIALELEKIENFKGVHIIILDSSYNVKYMVNMGFGGPGIQQNARNGARDKINIFARMLQNRADELVKSRYIIETSKDLRLNNNSIRIFALLNNNDYLIMDTPVEAIQESVAIANKFYLFTGIITIIIGSVFAFIFSRKFTRPILELNTITKRMATLNFNKRYPVKSRDEIGQLGTSINSLSEQLQTSISELKDANARLMEDIEKERKIDEMRKEFVYSVSHELKTPIALIRGYAEGLKININKDEENKDYYCDVIMDETIRMNKIVKQLLELSYLESGSANIEREEFYAIEMVRAYLKKNAMILKEKSIEVILEGDPGIIVNADYDKTEQVLANFVNNAMNHVDEKKIIAIRVEKKDAKARITVFNSGMHIPKDSLDKIWTSFYKVDKARTREYGGTGLGLSIVRAIQQSNHNSCGVINVENGVEFWFELDIA